MGSSVNCQFVWFQHPMYLYIIRTADKSIWLTIFIMLAIWSAAMMHLRLLSAMIWLGIWFFSALKIAAWCKQMVDVWMHILQKTILASEMPLGRRSWLGNDSEVWRSILSIVLWRFQNSPLRSPSLSWGSGRCRWVRFRPKIHAIRTTPPKGDKAEAPSPARTSERVGVCCGLLFTYASSVAGRFVNICRHSQHP